MRVLEVGQHAVGYAGRLAVRAGAEVIRMEPAQRDPAWASDLAMDAYLHAGKARLAWQPERLYQLATDADVVFVEAGTADGLLAMGFMDWSSSVCVAVTPFGLTGPERNWRATPATLLAMGGYTYLMGDPERAPLNLPGHYVEFQSGALAFAAGVAAYRCGEPQQIELSMLETVMSLSQFTTVRWHCAGEVRTRHGSDFWFVSPSNLFRCQDGWAYAVIVPNFWDPFVAMMGLPELLIDPRFATPDARMNHREELLELLRPVFARWTRAEVDARAAECRVPVGVVRSLSEVMNEPHLAERQFWETIHADSELKSPGLPYRKLGAAPSAQWLSDPA